MGTTLTGSFGNCTDPRSPQGLKPYPCGYCKDCKRTNIMPVPTYIPPKVRR